MHPDNNRNDILDTLSWLLFLLPAVPALVGFLLGIYDIGFWKTMATLLIAMVLTGGVCMVLMAKPETENGTVLVIYMLVSAIGWWLLGHFGVYVQNNFVSPLPQFISPAPWLLLLIPAGFTLFWSAAVAFGLGK